MDQIDAVQALDDIRNEHLRLFVQAVPPRYVSSTILPDYPRRVLCFVARLRTRMCGFQIQGLNRAGGK